MHRLYYSPGSCSLAAHIVLEEVGQPYEVELVSASGRLEGEMTATPEWRAVNPKARVPVLSGVRGRIGGSADMLTEVTAILFYLARCNPGAGLLPTEPEGEARCLEWMSYLSASVHATAYGQIWRPLRFVSDESDFGPVIAKGKDNVREQYSYIEALLADGRDWAVPGGYTIVDPYLLVFYRWGARIELDMRSCYPAWTKLAERIVERPAVQRVFKDERISLLFPADVPRPAFGTWRCRPHDVFCRSSLSIHGRRTRLLGATAGECGRQGAHRPQQRGEAVQIVEWVPGGESKDLHGTSLDLARLGSA
jgi:glutathione S-transferase